MYKVWSFVKWELAVDDGNTVSESNEEHPENELQIKLDKAKSLIKKVVATIKKKKLKRTCVELIAETFKLQEKQKRKKIWGILIFGERIEEFV